MQHSEVFIKYTDVITSKSHIEQRWCWDEVLFIKSLVAQEAEAAKKMAEEEDRVCIPRHISISTRSEYFKEKNRG